MENPRVTNDNRLDTQHYDAFLATGSDSSQPRRRPSLLSVEAASSDSPIDGPPRSPDQAAQQRLQHIADSVHEQYQRQQASQQSDSSLGSPASLRSELDSQAATSSTVSSAQTSVSDSDRSALEYGAVDLPGGLPPTFQPPSEPPILAYDDDWPYETNLPPDSFFSAMQIWQLEEYQDSTSRRPPAAEDDDKGSNDSHTTEVDQGSVNRLQAETDSHLRVQEQSADVSVRGSDHWLSLGPRPGRSFDEESIIWSASEPNSSARVSEDVINTPPGFRYEPLWRESTRGDAADLQGPPVLHLPLLEVEAIHQPLRPSLDSMGTDVSLESRDTSSYDGRSVEHSIQSGSAGRENSLDSFDSRLSFGHLSVSTSAISSLRMPRAAGRAAAQVQQSYPRLATSSFGRTSYESSIATSTASQANDMQLHHGPPVPAFFSHDGSDDLERRYPRPDHWPGRHSSSVDTSSTTQEEPGGVWNPYERARMREYHTWDASTDHIHSEVSFQEVYTEALGQLEPAHRSSMALPFTTLINVVPRSRAEETATPTRPTLSQGQGGGKEHSSQLRRRETRSKHTTGQSKSSVDDSSTNSQEEQDRPRSIQPDIFLRPSPGPHKTSKQASTRKPTTADGPGSSPSITSSITSKLKGVLARPSTAETDSSSRNASPVLGQTTSSFGYNPGKSPEIAQFAVMTRSISTDSNGQVSNSGSSASGSPKRSKDKITTKKDKPRHYVNPGYYWGNVLMEPMTQVLMGPQGPSAAQSKGASKHKSSTQSDRRPRKKDQSGVIVKISPANDPSSTADKGTARPVSHQGSSSRLRDAAAHSQGTMNDVARGLNGEATGTTPRVLSFKFSLDARRKSRKEQHDVARRRNESSPDQGEDDDRSQTPTGRQGSVKQVTDSITSPTSDSQTALQRTISAPPTTVNGANSPSKERKKSEGFWSSVLKHQSTTNTDVSSSISDSSSPAFGSAVKPSSASSVKAAPISRVMDALMFNAAMVPDLPIPLPVNGLGSSSSSSSPTTSMVNASSSAILPTTLSSSGKSQARGSHPGAVPPRQSTVAGNVSPSNDTVSGELSPSDGTPSFHAKFPGDVAEQQPVPALSRQASLSSGHHELHATPRTKVGSSGSFEQLQREQPEGPSPRSIPSSPNPKKLKGIHRSVFDEANPTTGANALGKMMSLNGSESPTSARDAAEEGFTGALRLRKKASRGLLNLL